MLCEKCNKNPATFHYTEVLNGVKNEHHLCNECAANTDVSYYSSIFDNDEQFTRLISGILGGKGIISDGENKDPATSVSCPRCKMTYGEFVKNSRFGCPECYDVFGLLISDKIKKIHGSSTHVGKHPLKYGEVKDVVRENADENNDSADIQKEIEILKKKQQAAVEIEDYTEAARIRDIIAKLNGKDKKDA